MYVCMYVCIQYIYVLYVCMYVYECVKVFLFGLWVRVHVFTNPNSPRGTRGAHGDVVRKTAAATRLTQQDRRLC